MAKMFYTLTEVCEKLSKSETEVEAMVASGQIQEFRDGEDLVFKVEQIELLTPNDDSGELDLNLDLDSSSLELDDSFGHGGSATGSIGLAGSQSADIPTPAAAPDLSGGIDESGSGIGLGSSSMMSGGGLASKDLDLSAELDSPPDSADASASAFDGAALDGGGDTQLGEGLDDDLTLESVGSGSGLLDLTRESDDTSLGAELLEEVYSSEDDIDFPAASGLFEASTEDDEVTPAQVAAIGSQAAPVSASPVMAAAQSWDPTWSGLSAGLMIGGLVALVAVFAITAVETMGGASGIASLMAEQIWMWVGGLLACTIVLGLIGWVVGGKTG